MRAAGEGVFHEFATDAVQPFRGTSERAPADLQARCAWRAAGCSRPASRLTSPRGYPSDLLVTNPITKERELFLATNQVNPYNFNSEGFSNQGKVVSGTDRAGDKWVITVHGPGYVVVTDTTPNDGALDDDINTIQLVNTSAKNDLCHRQRHPVESSCRPPATSCSISSSRSRVSSQSS